MCEQGELTFVEELEPHGRFIDSCMTEEIKKLIDDNFITLACCCGHDIYKKTIVVGSVDKPYEYYSGVYIPRKRKFYKLDDERRYYIPEVEEQ